MNWRVILFLSGFGLAMGLGTVFVVRADVEPFAWLAIFVVCAVVIARSCDGRHFLHGLCVSLVNSVWITGAHLVFFDRYLALHPREAAMAATTSSPRVMMLGMGPVVGLVSGVILGSFALVASRFVKPSPRASGGARSTNAPDLGREPRPWIVTAHEPIERIDDNLWAVEGEVPGFPRGCGMRRRMTIVRLRDGRLAFHNAVPLGDDALAAVRALGEPSILIVPMHLHAMDARAFAAKLGLRVYTSRTVVDQVRAILPVDGTLEELPAEGGLRAAPLAGTKFGEAAFVVRSGPRASLLFCDAFQNSRPGSGLNGALFKAMGFTGSHPRIPGAYKLRAVTDKVALKAALVALADTPDLARLVPSHGELVREDPSGTLRRTAERFL